MWIAEARIVSGSSDKRPLAGHDLPLSLAKISSVPVIVYDADFVKLMKQLGYN